jgi:hypothetical protein
MRTASKYDTIPVGAIVNAAAKAAGLHGGIPGLKSTTTLGDIRESMEMAKMAMPYIAYHANAAKENIKNIVNRFKGQSFPAPAGAPATTSAPSKTAKPSMLSTPPQTGLPTPPPLSNKQPGESGDRQSAANIQARQTAATINQPKRLGWRKRRQAIKILNRLYEQRAKLQKQISKFKPVTFFALTILAVFMDIIDAFINLLFATVILIPIGAIFWVIKQLSSAIIWIKIHNIAIDQETDEGFVNSCAAMIVKSVPIINFVPATTMCVLKAWHAARAKAQQRENEIKIIDKRIERIKKRLAR